MKVVETPDCLHCNEDDTILHFFIYCPRVTEFWTSFIAWWNRVAGTTGTINEIIVIFGVKIDGDEAITFNYCLIIYHQSAHCLRSTSDPSLLHIPKSRLKTFGDKSFSVYAPVQWNKLPLSIRTSSSVDSFKSALKTHLFIHHFSNF